MASGSVQGDGSQSGRTTVERILKRIQDCVETGEYSLARPLLHALRRENLTVPDLEAAILRGGLTAVYGKHGAGCRYVVSGLTTADEHVRTLCRFSASGKLVLLRLNGEGWAHSRKHVAW